METAGQGIGQGEELLNHRIAAGVGGRTLQSGAADCRRHDGRSKGPRTPSSGIKGPPRSEKVGAADPNINRRTCVALEATRTMKMPVLSPSSQGRVADGGRSSPETGAHNCWSSDLHHAGSRKTRAMTSAPVLGSRWSPSSITHMFSTYAVVSLQ